MASTIMADWFGVKVSQLIDVNEVEDKREILAEIKIKLGSLTAGEIELVCRNLDVNSLFSLLTLNDRAITEQTCIVLKMLFDVLEAGEVYQRYPLEAFRLISHSDVAVRLLVLRELLKTASEPTKQTLLLADIDLLVAIILRIADDNLTVAKTAMSIVKKVGEAVSGVQILYSGECLRTFARFVVKNDTVSFRVYEVIVEIAKRSKENLQATINSGFLSSLINILQSDDILLQLSALEEITELALTENGLKYLEEQGVLKGLVQKIAQADENTLSNLLIPGLMKFFGNVARLWPNEIFSKYPVVVSALFEVIDSEDEIILGVALDTLGHVASSAEGKYALQALGEPMLSTLKKIAEIIEKMPTGLRIRALNNLALILSIKMEEQDNRILSLTKSWFDSLCGDPLGMIVALCRQPFVDIRCASLEVLAVVASQAWGQESISSYPGLIEFLLDRNIESFKECKEAKYEVVKKLSQAEQYVFDATVRQKIHQFVKEGPFHVEASTEVAFEGAT